MHRDTNNLIWIDLEMTGLNPDSDYILEIASVVTNSDLEILAKGPVLAIHHGIDILETMDHWNTQTHGNSGLIDRVQASSIETRQAEKLTLEVLRQFVPKNTSPLCGNSICQDRRFLFRHMPELESYLHYRNLDVSTLKELSKRWMPELLEGLVKQNRHRALDDILESIDEMRHYRKQLFSVVKPINENIKALQ